MAKRPPTKAELAAQAKRDAAAAAWAARDADARSAGWGGLVPGTGITWVGAARMAHARRDAGITLDRTDELAIDRYPTCPPLIDTPTQPNR